MTMQYELGSVSCLGNRKKNEDSLGVFESSECLLLVVADGMGGHGGGEIASQTLVETLGHFFNRQIKPVPHPLIFLRHVIKEAHQAVIDRGYQHNPPLLPRATCAIALIQQGMLWTAHVGDSRAYLMRQNQTLFRTRDHSIVEELLQSGRINAKQAATHPERNMVTRCVGGELARAEPSLSGPTALEADDLLLLCSDGLWGAVNEADILLGLKRRNLDQAAFNLASQAELNNYPHADNTTLIALRWQGITETTQAEPEQPPEPAPGEVGELDKAISTLKHVFAKYGNEIK